MAKMVPSTLDRKGANRGEKAVFDRLKEDPETQEWIVLHSLALSDHIKQIEGEIDFVVIVPGEGVLCLEVKGSTDGSLRRDSEGLWFFGYSNEKGTSRSPFRQAKEGMFSLKKAVDHANLGVDVLFGSGVVFPFASFKERSPEWHDWEYVNSEGFRSRPLSSQIVVMLRSWRAHTLASGGGRVPTPGAPNMDQSKKILGILRSRFEIPIDRRAEVALGREEAARFTQEQFAALDVMAENPRVIFRGPAGVGKTFLALEGARKAALQGKRVLLVCFNRMLAEWLEVQVAQLDLKVKVASIHALMVQTSGVKVPENPQQVFWEEILPEQACDALLARDDRAPFDVMYADEAQDLLQEPYLDFLDLALEGGLAAGVWSMFGDFERQAIYGSSGLSLDDFRTQRGGRPAVYGLLKNCRNTPEVAQWVNLLSGLDPGYKEVRRQSTGHVPQLVFYNSPSEQERVLINKLEQLWVDQYRKSRIVVLSPRADSKCAASSITSEPWRSRLRPYTSAKQEGIPYCTIQSFKGLEADAVVVTDLDGIDSEYEQSVLYVALTRSLDRLVVIANESVRGAIVRALGFD